MNFYKTKNWIEKRKKILRRDEYLCANCRRFGRTIQATTVHHIYPFELYPELKLESNNLISLCEKCHNEMHDRENHKLTKLGKEWQKRKAPLINFKK